MTVVEQRQEAPRVARHRLFARPWLIVDSGLAAVIWFTALGRRSLWTDEGESLYAARLPWSRFFDYVTTNEPNQTLYYTCLKVWRSLGESETVLRSLSVVAAIGAVVFVYLLAERLFSPRAAAVAGLLMAVNGFALEHAQNARPYAMLLLLVSASTFCFVLAVQQPTWLRVAVYGAVSMVAIFAHAFALLVVVAQVLSLLFLLPVRELVRARVVAGAGAAAAIPLLFVALIGVGRRGRLDWIQPVTPARIARAAADVAGGSGWLLLAYAVPCSVALVAAFRAWRVSPRARTTWRYALVIAWLVVPMVLAVAGSLLVEPMLVSRYLIVSLPALVILAGAGASLVNSRVLFVVLLVPVFALSARAMWHWYHGSPNDDWRAATAYVLHHSANRDAILFDQANGVRLWSYYADGTRAPRPRLLDAQTSPPRIWFMASYGGRASKHPILAEHYEVVERRPYGSLLELFLYERAKP